MADDKKEKEVDHAKQAKKLFDSYSAVLEHKLGRQPTLDEIVGAIKAGVVKPSPVNPSNAVETLAKEPATAPASSGVAAIASPSVAPMDKAQEPTDLLAPMATPAPEAAVPKIFKIQVLYGNKTNEDGSKTPDPQTPLFYTDGQRHFDCSTDSWCDQPPEMAQHLMSRPLQHNAENTDVFDCLMHGVMDDEDYAALDQAGMIDQRCKKLRELMGQLSSQHDEYQALSSGGLEPVQKADDITNLHTDEDSAAEPVENFHEQMTGEAPDTINQPDNSTNAFADLINSAFGDGVDPRTKEAIRKMIREEVISVLNEGSPK